jgi:carboxymethylenebutenolidase
MGGALTLLSAVFVPESDAAVTWYGFPPLDYIDASKIKAPLMGHFGTDDAFFKIDQVDLLEAKLKAAGVKYTFHRYNAQHAFANENNVNSKLPLKYDPTAAETAWTRTLEFFHKQLG